MSSQTSQSIAPSYAFIRDLIWQRRFGVVTESLADTIRVATIGDVGPNLAHFDAGGRLVPIRVLLKDTARADPQALEQLGVPTAAARRAAFSDRGYSFWAWSNYDRQVGPIAPGIGRS